MRFKPPKKWEQESIRLFIHESGVRIERRLYRDKEGWFLIPASLDQEVVGFDPTPKGRDSAFAAFAEGLLAKTKKKKKALPDESAPKPRRGRKPKEDPEEDSEEDSEEAADAEDSEERERPTGPEDDS